MATDFAKTYELTGDIQRDDEPEGFRIFVGSHVASVSSGKYAGTDCVITGSSLVFYVKDNGKGIASVRFDLRPLFAAALAVAIGEEIDNGR